MEPPIFRLPPFVMETVHVALSEQIDWSLAAYRIPEQWHKSQGQGIVVAVLDTGVDAAHPDLLGAIDDMRDFTDSPYGVEDKVGHGTHTAGTIAARKNDGGVIGIAPECRLLVGKVLGDDGSGGDLGIARGIRWAVDSGAEIISMSLGSPRPGRQMQEAVAYAVKRGALVICAAGNDGRDNSVNYPARWSNTIAIGAVDRHGRVCDFSSRGEEVDIAAPGEDILSTIPKGRYAKMSGTSMATPFVSGTLALYLAQRKGEGKPPRSLDVIELRQLLKKTAGDAGSPGKDPCYGWGLIAPEKMLARSEGSPVPLPTMLLEGGELRIDDRRWKVNLRFEEMRG